MDGKEKLEPSTSNNPSHTLEELKQQSADIRKRNAETQKKLEELKQRSDNLKEADDSPIG